jgi:peptide/nickel transport system substrate-binding protein
MQVYKYDPRRAKELLTEAGYPNGIDAVIWAMDQGEDRMLLESVTEQLRQVGVRTTVYQFDRAVYWDKFNAYMTPDGKIFPRNPGVFDMFVAGWSGGESAFGFLDPLFRGGSFSNSCFYASAEIDALLNQCLQVTDPAARDDIYRKLQQVVVNDAPWIFSYCTKNIVGNHPRVEGWTASPAGEYEFQNVRLRETGKA